MAAVTKMRTPRLIKRALSRHPRRYAGVGPGRGRVCPWLRAAVWQLQDERLPCIDREGLPHRVDLPLHIGHGPRLHTRLQNPHVPREVVAGIFVQLGVGGCQRHLQRMSVSRRRLSSECGGRTKCSTMQVRTQ